MCDGSVFVCGRGLFTKCGGVGTNLFFMKENVENTFSFMQRFNGLVSSQITETENVLIILILAGNLVHVSEERALLGF